MVRIIQTANLKQVAGSNAVVYEGKILDERVQRDCYCGLDSCLTIEIHHVLDKQHDEYTRLVYNFERALQAPVLEMMLRGILTDSYEVARLRHIYDKRRQRVYDVLQRYAIAIWGQPLNPNSPTQLKKFFYEHMNVPTIYIYEKGEKKVSTNRESLEKVQQYRYARPVAIAVLAHRDLSKKIGVLNSGIDDDERLRFGINVAGTNTGRFSFNKNAFGGGTNSGNITDELRRIFVAPVGKKFAYIDLEQAESRVTAYVAGDEAYIKACESADLHVSVAKLIWPNLGWSHTIKGLNTDPDKFDKALAEESFWRHWSRRDMSKRGGHLTNYLGGAQSNAKALNVSLEVMKHFQRTYLGEFKGLPRMHTDIAREITTSRPTQIITPLGRKRLFFGRTYADDILRKAVAYRPQSSIGDILNVGMWRIWKHLREAELLTQLYDAVLIQYDDDPDVERRVLTRAMDLMTIPVLVTDTRLRGAMTRTMTVPVEASVGWNWAKIDKRDPAKNPDGLITYAGSDTRVRQVSPEDEIRTRLM